MCSYWNDGSENDSTNRFIIAWSLKVPEDPALDMVILTKMLTGADIESLSTKELVVKTSVEPLINVD